VSSHRKH